MSKQIRIHATKVLTPVLYLNKLPAFYLIHLGSSATPEGSGGGSGGVAMRWACTKTPCMSLQKRVRDNFIIIVYGV